MPNNITKPSCGYLEIITGPMFAGKTTRLVKKYFEKESYSRILIKFLRDTRFDEHCVTTHCKKYSIPASICAESLCQMLPSILSFDYIFVDEGQFFPDIKDFCVELLKLNKHVYVSGLCGTFKQELFPNNILNLVPICDNFLFLKAKCFHCKKNTAVFNFRNGDSNETILIGGDDLYSAMCRQCLAKNMV